MTANTPEEEKLITEATEEQPTSRWFVYHLIRLQGEMSQMERRMDEISSRQATILWALALVGVALLLNLAKG